MDPAFWYLTTSAERDQVRAAVRDWQLGDPQFDNDRLRDGRFGFRRLNAGAPSNPDLRSVILHEVGHMLGFQHGDAGWYNDNSETGLPYGHNYILQNGVPVKQAPQGPEIMNEGWGTPTTKGPKGLRAGEYIRLLSDDEVIALSYLGYGEQRPYYFQEVDQQSAAQITISPMFDPGSTLGSAGSDERVERTWPGSRWEIIRSSGSINLERAKILPLSMTWEFTNTLGIDVYGLDLQTNGTDHQKSLDSSSQGTHWFTSTGKRNAWHGYHMEDVTWEFRYPVDGYVPVDDTVQLSLKLDVWDWTLLRAEAIDLNGGFHRGFALATINNWKGGYSTPPQRSDDPLPQRGQKHEFIEHVAEIPSIEGMKIVNGSKIDQLTVSSLKLAPLGDRSNGLGFLNRETLDQLDSEGEVRTISFSPIELDPETELVVILDRDTVPPELLAESPTTTYVAVDLSDIAADTLFAAVDTESEGVTATAFSIVNDTPYDSGPELCASDPSVDGCCEDYDYIWEGTSAPDAMLGEVVASGVSECVFAYAGQDFVTLAGDESDFVALGDGGDFLTSSGGNDVVLAEDGGDYVSVGGEGNDTVVAGPGADFVIAYGGTNTLDGGSGADAIFGGWNSDNVEGGSGADWIFTESGDDDIAPGSGADIVDAGFGNDTVRLRDVCEYDAPKQLWGGPGMDTLILPTTQAEAQAAGISISEFEQIIENDISQSGESDCTPTTEGI
ncbi:MAG: hypothetical protein V3V08_06505 [Nannocystaceae bacterium]